MNKKLKFIFLIIFILLVTVSVVSVVYDSILVLENQKLNVLSSKVKLQYDENGKFKVLTIADVHANGTLPENVKNNIETLVEREKPNLVIFTGDNTITNSPNKVRSSLESMVEYIEKLQIPWCHVYGNHDDESGVSKEIQQVIYESFDYCVSKRGESQLTGVGNYVLPVYKYNSHEVASLVWCLDSGTYLNTLDQTRQPDPEDIYVERPNSPYAYIHQDQIEWYKNTSMMLEEKFNKKLPSLMAFHIPLQESYYAWIQRESLEEWTGEKHENVAASRFNSGLFDVLVERKDVLAVVNGHDHINDFMVKYQDIRLCYSPNVSTLTYFEEYMMGGRVFIFDQNDLTDVETYVSYLFRNQK